MKLSNRSESMPADRTPSGDQCLSADLWMDGIMAAFWLPTPPVQATADVVPSRMRDDGEGRQLLPRPRRQRNIGLRLRHRLINENAYYTHIIEGITMKRVLFLIAFISLVVGMASCDTNPIVTEEKGVLAMVDGASWKSGRPSAVRVSPPGRITIAAVQGGDALYLTLKPTGVGTVDLSGDDNNASFQRNEVEYQTELPGGSGSATITKFDPERQLISGTFSFVAVNPGNGSVAVSGGSFRDLEWSEQ